LPDGCGDDSACIDAVRRVRDGIARDDLAGPGLDQLLVGPVGKDAMDRKAVRGGIAGLAQPLDGLDHCAACRDDIVHHDRRSQIAIGCFEWRDLDLPVPGSVLLEHQMGRAGVRCDGTDPLRALLIGADDDRRWDMIADPSSDERSRLCRYDGNPVNLGERAAAMKMRSTVTIQSKERLIASAK
jgi:hypothetical protein